MKSIIALAAELFAKADILNGHDPSFSAELKLVAEMLTMGELGGAHEALLRLADAAHLLDRRNLRDWLQEQLIVLEAAMTGAPEPVVACTPLPSERLADQRLRLGA